jgi:hypothetical protein
MAKNNEVVENNEVTEAVVKPKRVRKPAPPKETKTGLQIMAHINGLQKELETLEHEVSEVNPTSTLYPIVNDIVVAKRAELDNAMSFIYTV